ncbi:hypothetical protein K435DRAFT_866467, partial [Dendrothele bispora CBS 962.96]
VVGRVEEYLRSFERFDIRNFSRALGDFLEDRDIDDPELDLQYPSTDTPAAPTIDATVETIMRGPASPVTESEASAGNTPQAILRLLSRLRQGLRPPVFSPGVSYYSLLGV